MQLTDMPSPHKPACVHKVETLHVAFQTKRSALVQCLRMGCPSAQTSLRTVAGTSGCICPPLRPHLVSLRALIDAKQVPPIRASNGCIALRCFFTETCSLQLGRDADCMGFSGQMGSLPKTPAPPKCTQWLLRADVPTPPRAGLRALLCWRTQHHTAATKAATTTNRTKRNTAIQHATPRTPPPQVPPLLLSLPPHCHQ